MSVDLAIVLVLALDTSTPAVTAGLVSLLRPHELVAAPAAGPLPPPLTLLAERSVTSQFAHAEQLMPMVTRAVAEAGHRLSEIEAVVAGIGPGPFTGLRVGLATATALGDALDIPAHGVPSQDATAQQIVEHQRPAGDFAVVTDARRREVYLSVYAESGRRLLGPQVLAPAAIAETLAASALTVTAVAGAGADLVRAYLNVLYLSGLGSVVCGLVTCAARSLLTGAIPGPLVPLYLRRPDAIPPAPRRPAAIVQPAS